MNWNSQWTGKLVMEGEWKRNQDNLDADRRMWWHKERERERVRVRQTQRKMEADRQTDSWRETEKNRERVTAVHKKGIHLPFKSDVSSEVLEEDKELNKDISAEVTVRQLQVQELKQSNDSLENTYSMWKVMCITLKSSSESHAHVSLATTTKVDKHKENCLIRKGECIILLRCQIRNGGCNFPLASNPFNSSVVALDWPGKICRLTNTINSQPYTILKIC